MKHNPTDAERIDAYSLALENLRALTKALACMVETKNEREVESMAYLVNAYAEKVYMENGEWSDLLKYGISRENIHDERRA